ncbi:hypothetical protein GYMLUDRAFT_135429, partial [Collybiopsis luxurians FD-317 M1]
CLPGTRVAILKSLMKWATSPESPHIFWLYGIAGTGKSTIAQSFCKLLEKRGFIVASFFCSRNSTERKDILRIIPTIAESIATRDKKYRDIVTRVLEEDPHVAKYSVSEQIKQLLLKNYISFQKHWVLVIDGLDECSDSRLIRLAIEILVDNAHILPARVFIASREEREISSKFQSNSYATQVALHEVQRFIVQSDIYRYLEFELSRILSLTPPIDAIVEYLVKQSDRLFIYASTAVKYIADGFNSDERVKNLMAQKTLHGINKLYAEILNNADANLEDVDISILHSMMCLQDPLSITALDTLLNTKSYQSLSAFKSVLYIPNNIESDVAVQSFHASFPEFLEEYRNCPTRFYLGADQQQNQHSYLALCCLRLLNVALIRNPLQQELHTDVSQVDRQQLNKYMDYHPGLKYACEFWMAHWKMGFNSPHFASEKDFVLKQFIDKNLLKWVEHLILLQIPDIRGYVYGILPYLEDKPLHYFSDLCAFLSQSAEILIKWPLEIYNSAILWTPHFSYLKHLQCFQEKMLTAPILVAKHETWSDCEQAINMGNKVTALATFSDNTRLVVALDNQTVRIWNLSIGQAEHILQGHSGFIITVAVSANNFRIVSGSSDGTIRVWNTTTGNLEKELLVAETVLAVAISSDSSRIVSGTNRGNIRIWNVVTGELEQLLPTSSSNPVTAVAFFSNINKVVSGSHNASIRVWDTRTGGAEWSYNGHSDTVCALSIQSDNSRIMSWSYDHTLRIWNVSSGEIEDIYDTYIHNMTAVAVFSDDSRIVSGSVDGTVRIWNTSSRREDIITEHSDLVTVVTLFPDNSRIVSGSDDNTIRIWSTSTGRVEHVLTGHTGWITAVTVFPDCSRIVSASYDWTIRIWNSSSGRSECVLKGHSECVLNVIISPDISRVVSRSDDNTIRIWNILNGKTEHILQDVFTHNGSLAIFPDSSRIATGSHFGTIRIQDISTGKLHHTLTTDYDSIAAIAIFPDNSKIISVSDNNAIIIWNAITGKIVYRMTFPSIGVKNIVVSPDG